MILRSLFLRRFTYSQASQCTVYTTSQFYSWILIVVCSVKTHWKENEVVPTGGNPDRKCPVNNFVWRSKSESKYLLLRSCIMETAYKSHTKRIPITRYLLRSKYFLIFCDWSSRKKFIISKPLSFYNLRSCEWSVFKF